MAMEMGLDQIISEGDFEVLIKVLKSGVNHLAHFGHIANDICEYMTRTNRYLSALGSQSLTVC